MTVEPLWSDSDGILYCTLGYFQDHYGAGYRTAQTWITTSRARMISVNGTTYIHLGDALRLHRDTKMRNRPKRASA